MDGKDLIDELDGIEEIDELDGIEVTDGLDGMIDGLNRLDYDKLDKLDGLKKIVNVFNWYKIMKRIYLVSAVFTTR